MKLDNHIVTYRLYNRGNINLKFLDVKIREEVNKLFNLKFKYSELQLLYKHFNDLDFIDYLSKLDIGNAASMNQDINNLYYTGKISDLIPFETLIMSTVNEVFSNHTLETMGKFSNEHEQAFIRKTDEKIKLIKSCRNINFVEFGTRRRSNIKFQEIFIEKCLKEIPDKLIGTSNISLANKYNIPAIGTIAHEMNMLYAALAQYQFNKDYQYRNIESYEIDIIQADYLEESQKQLVSDYIKIFPDTYFLTDTYGSEWFLKNIKESINLRQDSGSIAHFVKLLGKYNKTSSKIMFSDNLNTHKIIDIRYQYPNLDCSFGWGTDTSNDGLISPLNIVIKLQSLYIDDYKYNTVKLSDDPGKFLGSKEDITTYKRAFNYKD
jgi:nicotinate phosphoribosyltransferase